MQKTAKDIVQLEWKLTIKIILMRIMHLTIKLTASSSLTSNATSECHAQNNRNHCSVGVGENPLNNY